MNKPLVRKFQPPGTSQAVELRVAPPTAAVHELAVSHVEIPEINTDFIDNLWQDPSFVDRFDAGFDKTVPMGLEGGDASSPKRDSDSEPKNLLDFDFQGKTDVNKGG